MEARAQKGLGCGGQRSAGHQTSHTRGWIVGSLVPGVRVAEGWGRGGFENLNTYSKEGESFLQPAEEGQQSLTLFEGCHREIKLRVCSSGFRLPIRT